MVFVLSIGDDQKLAVDELQHNLSDHHQDSAQTNLKNYAPKNRTKTGDFKKSLIKK